jgi:outer membrane protein assembly factor BamB
VFVQSNFQFSCYLGQLATVLFQAMNRIASRWGSGFLVLRTSVQVLVLGSLPCSAFGQEFWPQFRGPAGQGVASSARPPLTFSRSNALWATELPVGHSSPCIWGDTIFLSTFATNKLDCRAYDRANGSLLWSQTVPAEKIEATQEFNNPAAATPAADAERVVFYFGSYGLLAYTHDGKRVWDRKLPAQVSRGKYGSASSPILCGDLLIQALDTDEGGSRLLALKRATGETAWETPRPLFSSGWSTPVIWTGNGKPQIVLLGSKKLTAYEPSDGKELWSVAGFPIETAASPAFDERQVFACSSALGGRPEPKYGDAGWQDLLKFDTNKVGKVKITEVPESYRLVIRPELPEGHPGRTLPFPIRGMLEGMDKDKDGAVSKEEWDNNMAGFESMDTPVLMALRPGQTNGEWTPTVAWKVVHGIPEIPSPVCYQGKIFLVRDGGLVECLEADSGTVLYNERLGVGGGYASSPIAADGRVYFASQSGTITVIDAGSDHLKVLATNALGEQITATPAMVDDKLYVRTAKHLFAFGVKP